MNTNEIIEQETTEEIDLKEFVRLFIRNKFWIISITSLASILSLIFSYTSKPIYRGSFQIVVKTKDDPSQKLLPNNVFRAFSNLKSNQKTQEFILKSPSVLKPVYNFTQKRLLEKGDNEKTLTYKKWFKSALSIRFAEGTQVLDIAYKGTNKKNIIATLNLISNKYQNYSKQDREKELTKTYKYLLSQNEKLKIKSKESLIELNKFSIDNGLGDIDGFVSLGDKNNLNKMIASYDLDIDNKNLLTQKIETTRNDNDAGQRFSNQFKLLEKYEAEYLNYSSKLKPNSKLLINLKVRIENLREALQRPNEILLKYRELTKRAERDESLLNNIQREISFVNLEMAKQQDPWELISEPTIDDVRVSPKRKRSLIITFISAFIMSLIISNLREKFLGIIYGLNDFKRSIECPFLDTIFIKNQELSNKIITSFVERRSKLNKSEDTILKTAIISFLKDEFLSKKNKELTEKYYYFESFDKEFSPEEYDNIIFIISSGNLSKTDLILINKYSKIFQEKTIGWFFLDTQTSI